jgi:para-aminobenzoate synthetase
MNGPWKHRSEKNTGLASTSQTIQHEDAEKSGIDILAASLPPGSMTGAPKRRACQILHKLEDRPRGVYSGVLGYLDVGGGGDFSVVIRSAFRWDSANVNADLERSATNGELNLSQSDNDDEFGHGRHGSNTGNGGQSSERNATYGDIWHVGAGGAVTSLSTENGEWEEMKAKMKSTMGIFDSKRVPSE